MEPKWLQYLRETSPDLYTEYKRDSKWAIEWRDLYIAKLEKTLFLAESEDIEGCYAIVQKWVDCHEMLKL